MNRYRMQFAPHVWKPNIKPSLVRWLQPFRVRHQRRTQQLMDVTFRGDEVVRQLLADGAGVMLMPNHSSHADPFTIYTAGDHVGTPLHIMATWHVFESHSRLMRWILSCHGCFSVDRESNDIGAFRQAVTILEQKREPLVIFPEGEIYHCNDRVTPFRDGASAIAIAAARKAKRKIYCLPTAIRYRYLDDPTPSLNQMMSELERAIMWRSRHHEPLDKRIYQFAEALLAVKELEYYGKTENGPLPNRIRQLGDHILSQVEGAHDISSTESSLPERVKTARRTIMQALAETENLEQKSILNDQLEDLFLVVQSFSYPGDYVAGKPSVERMAETLDKFEEDVLRKPTASIRAPRSATIAFCEPIEVSGARGQKGYASDLTKQVEQQVQRLLDADQP